MRREPGCICLHGASHSCLCANNWRAHSRHLIKTERETNLCYRGSWPPGTGPPGEAVLLGVSKAPPPPHWPGAEKAGGGRPWQVWPRAHPSQAPVRLLRGFSLRDTEHFSLPGACSKEGGKCPQPGGGQAGSTSGPGISRSDQA